MIPEERPKPVTMDDLNAKMSELLDRMNRLEAEKERGALYDVKPSNGYAPKSSKQSNDPRLSANSRNASGGQKSVGGTPANGTEQP